MPITFKTAPVHYKDENGDYQQIGAAGAGNITEAVNDWLGDHPEATTTVQDASLTESKFTPSTLVDMKNYVVTPQMYGAIGDGVTDDTEAIQAAINAQKKVYFPKGTYKITSPLTVTLGQTIEGDSKYNAIIKAVGCDCIHCANGDQGERGTIKCIHLSGDFTTGTIGVRLGGLAPGWVVDDVWIEAFDYGVANIGVGNVNNIYITKCIITGSRSNNVNMKAGIYLPIDHGQVNAITIRDTEINMFESGIMIGGMAISIIQCTIQTCLNGIVSDAGLNYSSGDYKNTAGLTINGCYFEGIEQSAIFLDSRNHNTEKTAGFFYGVQITNNYIYKSSNMDQNYAAILRLVRGTTYSKSAPNSGFMLGGEFSNFFIGMNFVYKLDACKAYDIECCLGADSIVMDAAIGGNNKSHLLRDTADGLVRTGANLFIQGLTKKIQTTFSAFHWYKNDKVSIVNEHTARLEKNGVLILYLNDIRLYELSCSINATEYPVKLLCTVLPRARTDGLLHNTKFVDGKICINFDNDYEKKDWESDLGYGQFQPSTVFTPFNSAHHMGSMYSWNDVSGYALVLHSMNDEPFDFNLPMLSIIG